MATFETTTSIFRTALKPDTNILQDTNDSAADLNSARHGQFQEKKKTPTTEVNNLLFKFFSTENNKRLATLLIFFDTHFSTSLYSPTYGGFRLLYEELLLYFFLLVITPYIVFEFKSLWKSPICIFCVKFSATYCPLLTQFQRGCFGEVFVGLGKNRDDLLTTSSSRYCLICYNKLV